MLSKKTAKRIVMLFCSYQILALTVNAQSKFIVVGQTDSMIVTKCVPPIALCTGYCDPFVYYLNSYSIDLNHDGMADFALTVNAALVEHISAGGGDNYNGSLQIYLNQNCFMAGQKSAWYSGCSDTSTYPIYCQPPVNGYATVAKNYAAGDTFYLNAPISWLGYPIDTCVATADTVGWLISACELVDSSVVNTSYYCSGDGANPPYIYYCFKLIINNDTLLGYLHLSQFYVHDNGEGGVTGGPLYLYDFAVQGVQSIDTITAINDVSNQPIVNVFPNPFNQVLHISGNKHYTYSIYSINGTLIKTGDNQDIDASEMAQGFYILELKNEDGVSMQKIAKAN